MRPPPRPAQSRTTSARGKTGEESRALYGIVRALSALFLRAWFSLRLRIEVNGKGGHDNISRKHSGRDIPRAWPLLITGYIRTIFQRRSARGWLAKMICNAMSNETGTAYRKMYRKMEGTSGEPNVVLKRQLASLRTESDPRIAYVNADHGRTTSVASRAIRTLPCRMSPPSRVAPTLFSVHTSTRKPRDI